MQRRTASSGALAGEPADLTISRLPPRSPLAPMHGLRTPPTCPTSPLLGAFPAHAASPLSAGARSGSSTPARARGGPCHALPLDMPQSHVLPGIVTSAFESNITAAQCYSAYPARMHTAPPLVGRIGDAGAGGAGHHHHNHHHGQLSPALMSARSSIVTHGHVGFMGATSDLLNDINDVDFGLATCLATPMDPGPGLMERRLVPLPATTTAAARTAAAKLTSANDILNDASRYGDWVRRQRRRKRLERMQGVLAECGASAVLGRLMDDTLHEYDPARRGTGHLGSSSVSSLGSGDSMDEEAGGCSSRDGNDHAAGSLREKRIGSSGDMVAAAASGAECGLGEPAREVGAEQQRDQQLQERRGARRALVALMEPRGNGGNGSAGDGRFPERFSGFRDDMALDDN